MRAFRVLGSLLMSIQLAACVTDDDVSDDPSTEAAAADDDSADQLPDEADEASSIDGALAPVNEELPQLKTKQPGFNGPGCSHCVGR